MRFDDFSGAWMIAREINDFRSGKLGRFTGTAQFSPVETGLAYSEIGTLDVPGSAKMTAEQRYTWHKSGQGAEVFFADGRAFHFVDLSQVHPTASHDCPPDWYDVSYDFSSWPIWSALWRVRGPRKDYELSSVYSRKS